MPRHINFEERDMSDFDTDNTLDDPEGLEAFKAENPEVVAANAALAAKTAER